MLLKGNMETIDCIICGDKNGAITEIMHWKDDKLHFAICPECGLKYMQRRPKATWYSEFYQKEFWQISRRKKRDLPNAQADMKEMIWEESKKIDESTATSVEDVIDSGNEHAKQIWDIISPIIQLTSESVVLDIGSAYGHIAQYLKNKTGCTVMSTEPSDLGRSYISKQNIPLLSRTIEELEFIDDLDGKFDLIVLGYVLENTNDPINNLKIARRLLSENGVIYIDTSNFYYNNAINPYHPFIFSPRTLTAVLNKAGFHAVYQECEPNPMDIERVESFDKAIYIKTVATPGQIDNSYLPSKYPVLDAQKKGLELAEFVRQT